LIKFLASLPWRRRTRRTRRRRRRTWRTRRGGGGGGKRLYLRSEGTEKMQDMAGAVRGGEVPAACALLTPHVQESLYFDLLKGDDEWGADSAAGYYAGAEVEDP